jgi:hypothetical protein
MLDHKFSLHIFQLTPFDKAWSQIYIYIAVVLLTCRSHWPRGVSRTVFGRSDAGIVGSNPTQGMDVCVRLFCVCVVVCVGSGLTTG